MENTVTVTDVDFNQNGKLLAKPKAEVCNIYSIESQAFGISSCTAEKAVVEWIQGCRSDKPGMGEVVKPKCS